MSYHLRPCLLFEVQPKAMLMSMSNAATESHMNVSGFSWYLGRWWCLGLRSGEGHVRVHGLTAAKSMWMPVSWVATKYQVDVQNLFCDQKPYRLMSVICIREPCPGPWPYCIQKPCLWSVQMTEIIWKPTSLVSREQISYFCSVINVFS